MRSGVWLTVLAVVTAMAGTVVSLQVWRRVTQAEETAARLSAETLLMNTQRELALFTDVLDSIGALHALSDEVSPSAMAEFVEKGLVHQQAVLGTFGLAQRISPAVRFAMEESARRSPGGGYLVTEWGPDGIWVEAGPRVVYYPLTWQTGEKALAVPIGFDFGACSSTRDMIRRMEERREPVISHLPAPTSSGQEQDFWVFAPIETGRTPGRGLLGFAAARLNPDVIVQRVLALSVPVPGLQVILLPGDEQGSGQSEVRRANGGWIFRQTVQVVDMPWTFECRLPAGVTGNRAPVAAVAGLSMTALLSGLLLVLAGRARQIEHEVRIRTRDLHSAKAALEETLQERARLEEEMYKLASREQRRLGRDLHDSLGQKLTGAVFLSRSLLGRFTEDSDEAKVHARTLNETLKEAVNEVRSMARGLAPVSLHDEELDRALEQLVLEMTGLYGVSCEVARCAELPGMERNEKEQLYYIAREAVNNAARHAGAQRVTLELVHAGGGWRLSVTDDGCGMPDSMPAGGGMGIRIMRHRAQMIDATFRLEPADGGGTVVTVEKSG